MAVSSSGSCVCLNEAGLQSQMLGCLQISRCLPPLPQHCSSGASEAMELAWVWAAWTSLLVWTHLVSLAEFPLLASRLSLAVQLPRLMCKCPRKPHVN